MKSVLFRICLTVVATLISILRHPVLGDAAERVVLASDGKALHPVVVAKGASSATMAAAVNLSRYLSEIAEAKFEVVTGEGERGIVVGTKSDFPRIRKQNALQSDGVEHREDYLLRSHLDGIWLIGNTDLAVRHATWDLLRRLGYRQYFPGKKWEIIPSDKQLSIAVDAFEHPSYLSRRIWYGFGTWDHSKEPYRDWCEKNRCIAGIELNTGHGYDGIIARNKADFERHPEYYGLLNGKRVSTKLCISNPGLRKLVVDDAIAQLEADPKKQSVSVDPSDGGGWCECPNCSRLGSISDRAITLANVVAEAVTAKDPNQYVGIYAYNQHSPPPNIDVHPRVVVSIATAFINGGYNVDELFNGWSKKASILGIREYYSVNSWDRDLPGAARGGKIDYLKETIPHFYQQSARFMSAESSDNWAPNGLGYYLAAQMLWDVREAARVNEMRREFLDDCFGDAHEPMDRFYRLLDGSERRQPLSDDLLGRMYRLLSEAHSQSADPAVHARLDDLVLYTRFVELWLDYSTSSANERQSAFEAMIRHAYRMRSTMMIHTLALYRDVHYRDKSVSIPPDAIFSVPEGKNPWKSSTRFSKNEMAEIARNGIENRKLLDFEPVAFSSDLVPAKPLKLHSGKLGSMGLYSRAPRTYYTWISRAPASISMNVTAGIVYSNRGNARVNLFPLAEAELKSVAEAEVTPTKMPQTVTLKTDFEGLHRIEIIGGGAASSTWTDGMPMTIESSFERTGEFHGRWALYFYVPKGTKRIGGFSENEGILRDPRGAVAYKFDNKPGYFSIAVPSGQAGELWKFENCAGDKRLMTVPPFLARSADELLIPREVIERDSTR